MGYLLKLEVMEALREDKETSMMCYDDEATRAIVKFCYDSMERELEQLRLYEVENEEEEGHICGNEECPYYKKDMECPAAVGCGGFVNEDTEDYEDDELN